MPNEQSTIVKPSDTEIRSILQKLLPSSVIKELVKKSGVKLYWRLLTPLVLVWCFIYQRLSKGQATNQHGTAYWVVARVLAAFCLHSETLVAATEAAYSTSEPALLREVMSQDPEKNSIYVSDQGIVLCYFCFVILSASEESLFGDASFHEMLHCVQDDMNPSIQK